MLQCKKDGYLKHKAQDYEFFHHKVDIVILQKLSRIVEKNCIRL